MEQAIKSTDISVEDLEIIWPLAAPLIEKALFYTFGGRNLDDILQQLFEQTARLWIFYEDTGRIHAAAVCEIRRYPRRTICEVSLMGGENMEQWEGHYEAIGEWALQNGADLLVAHTRPGIVRRMAAHGFAPRQIVISKELIKRSLH